MGAHTIGRMTMAHSLFKYTWTVRQGHTFNNAYYKNIVNKNDWFIESQVCVQNSDESKKTKSLLRTVTPAALLETLTVTCLTPSGCPPCRSVTVSRVTCHVSRVTCIFVTIKSPGFHQERWSDALDQNALCLRLLRPSTRARGPPPEEL